MMMSRQERFSAEQVSTPDSPRARQLSISSAIFRSQGNRSASVSGVPPCIFSTFPAGCRSSPSWNWQPSAAASKAETVVLPDPETPMTTAITGTVMECAMAADHTRRGRRSLLIIIRSFLTARRCPPERNTATLLSRGSCAGRAQNKLLHRFGEALVLVAVGHRARLRLHLVAGVAHRDGKAALAEHKDVIRH